MAHYNLNKKTVASLKTRNYEIQLEEDPGILNQIFKVLDGEDISAKQLIPCLATLPKEVCYCECCHETTYFCKKTKSYNKKTPNGLEKLYLDFSEGKVEMSAANVGVFSQNLGITAYTLENYSNFKNKFLFNNGSTLEINYYYNNISQESKVSFTELSETNVLSNQKFSGMDKFRVRKSLGKIKKMRVKMNKTKKKYEE